MTNNNKKNATKTKSNKKKRKIEKLVEPNQRETNKRTNRPIWTIYEKKKKKKDRTLTTKTKKKN